MSKSKKNKVENNNQKTPTNNQFSNQKNGPEMKDDKNQGNK